MGATTQKATNVPTMALARQAAAAPVVRFAGVWTLGQGPHVEAQVAVIRDALRSGDAVAFDLSEVTRWDTSLPMAVLRVIDVCEEVGATADLKTLPDNVGKLIALAQAVPEADVGPLEPSTVFTQAAAMAVAVWESFRNGLQFCGEASLALANTLKSPGIFRWREFFVLLGDCGFRALPIVGMIAFLTGLILAFVGAIQLKTFGADLYVADLVGLAMTREMASLMTGMIMAGRSGAAFAAHLGTMKVSEEIDALTTFGFHPVAMLALPRLIALVLMMPLLTIYSDLLGYLGGAALGWFMLDISPRQYLSETQTMVTMIDVNIGLVKSAVFGFIIAACGCYQGMNCGRDAASVGQAATHAVVLSITYIVIADAIFAVICEILGL